MKPWLAVIVLMAAFQVTAVEPARRDIVVLLGEDDPGSGAFFESARAYFLQQLRPDVDLVISGARSLQDAREWLVRSHRHGDPAWGRIILVAHGSPWIGLDVPLYADGSSADLPDLERAIETGAFPPLPDSVFDAQTRLVIESCGVGRRTDLLALYARLLAGPEANASGVQASPNWIEFGHSVDSLGRRENWRRERAFEADVVAHSQLDTRTANRLRAVLSARLGNRDGQAVAPVTRTWKTAPVHVELAIEDARMCRSNQAVRRLSGHVSVLEKLRAYGLRQDQLAWRVSQSETGCTLEGRATIIVLGEGELAGSLIDE